MTNNDGAHLLGSVEPVGLRHRHVQHLRKVLRKRRDRSDAGQFGIEGPGLVLEALASDIVVTQVFVSESEQGSHVVREALAADVDVLVVNDRGIEAIGTTVSPQPVYALAELPAGSLEAALDVATPFVLVLAELADPGNVGTLIRVAEASGADAVVLAGDAVDPFGPKCVRASAGSVFRVPVIVDRDLDGLLAKLGEAGVQRFGATLGAELSFTEADYQGPSAVVLGNEAHGLGANASALLDQNVLIPMAGRTESLNVAMAGTLLAFEVFRQRTKP